MILVDRAKPKSLPNKSHNYQPTTKNIKTKGTPTMTLRPLRQRGILVLSTVAAISQCASAFSFTSSALFSTTRLPNPPRTLQTKTVLQQSQLPSTRSSSRLHYSIDISEEAPRDIPSLEQWASSYGIQTSDGFQLTAHELDQNGFLDVSAMTTQDIPAQTPVLYIPNEVILSSSKAEQEFGHLPCMTQAIDRIIANGAQSELRQYYLMIKLLVEYEKGAESPWFPYLNSLPRYFSNGPSMTPFCYRCIPSFLSLLCQKERANMNHLMVKGISFLSDETKGNSDLWQWVYQIVYTRSVESDGSVASGDDGSDSNNSGGGSGDLYLLPMGDMFNHGSAETEVDYAYDDYGNCYVQTTHDIPAGSPLRRCYGDPTNPSFLFARYGFLDESAPATFCKLLPTGTTFRHVNNEMKQLGYAYNRMLFYKDTGDVSDEVWDILLYLVLGEEDKNNNEQMQQQFFQAHMSGDYPTKQWFHEQWYPQTAEKLLNHIEEFLAELDSLEEKVAYGGKVAVGDHPRLPLILRHNAFVKNTFLTVKSRYFPNE